MGNKANKAIEQAANTVDAPKAVEAVADLVITAETHATGALFNIGEDRRVENGPIMQGSIRGDGGLSSPVSMFLEAAKQTGEIYATLSIGSKDRVHYFGRLFRGTSAAAPTYSGYVHVLAVQTKQQYTDEQWQAAPKLQVCGWRRRSANGDARIQLTIAPKIVHEGELAF